MSDIRSRRILQLLFIIGFAVICFSGCGIAEDIRSRIAEKIDSTADPVSEQELVRLVIEGINDRNSVAESYSGIPEIQRQSITFSSYTEYLDIIRELSAQNDNTVSSFRIMSETELESISDEMGIDDRSGLCCAELLYDNAVEIPVYVFYEKGSDGISYLSEEWIRGEIAIYNYAEHYFNMLSEENTDGLFTLLKPGFDTSLYSDEAIYKCAQSLTEYYSLKVKSPRDSYRYTELTPDRLKIIIPETLSDDNNSVLEHAVTITSEGGGSYSINDSAPLETNIKFIYVFSESASRLLQCGGNNYSDSTLRTVLGEPNFIVKGEITGSRTDSYGTVYYKRNLVVWYSDLVLVFDAFMSDSGSWQGKLTGIRITGDSYFTGDNVTVGMTAGELVEIYPYIDQYDYMITYHGMFSDYNIDISFDKEDTISMIRIHEE